MIRHHAGLALGIAALAVATTSAPAAAATVPKLVAVTEDGGLLLFRADRPTEVRRVEPQGIGGRLLGVDMRPTDGKLYGITSTNDVYRIDPATGAATQVSSLTVPFDGDIRSGVDFNPQADRLRLVRGRCNPFRPLQEVRWRLAAGRCRRCRWRRRRA